MEVHVILPFFIAFLVLSPTLVFASWETVTRDYFSSGLQTVFVDKSSLKRDGNLATISLLVDYKWMQGNYVGTPRFLSTTALKQFDCGAQRVRPLSFTDYYGHMATGTAMMAHIEYDKWQRIEPQTLNQALWEIACRTRELHSN